MRVLLSLLPMVGCAVMMLACMGRMGRLGRHKGSADSAPAAEEDVVALRADAARLRAERPAPAVEPADR